MAAALPSSRSHDVWSAQSNFPLSGTVKYRVVHGVSMIVNNEVDSIIHQRIADVKSALTKPNKRVQYTVFCTVLRDIRSSFMHFTFYIESPNTHKYIVMPVTDLKNKLAKFHYEIPAFILNKCYRLLKCNKQNPKPVTDITLKFTWNMTIEQINTIYELLKIVNNENVSLFTIDETSVKTMLIDNREVVLIDV